MKLVKLTLGHKLPLVRPLCDGLKYEVRIGI